jgi:hypothetical protein
MMQYDSLVKLRILAQMVTNNDVRGLSADKYISSIPWQRVEAIQIDFSSLLNF